LISFRGSLRDSLKNLPLATPLRHRAWLKLARREEQGVKNFADVLGIPMLSRSSIARLGGEFQDKRFYIFGNGSSVNSLTESDFEEIRNGVSVGTNAWPLHPFVPDLYSFEFSRHSTEPDPELAFLVERAESNLQGATNGALLFLRPGLPAGLRAMVPLAPEPKGTSFLYGRSNFFSTTPRGLETDLEKILGEIGRGSLSGSVLPDNGASVIRMIFLALIAGFREIVLLGVDLNDNPYFWYDRRFVTRYGDFRQQSSRKPDDSTLTQSTSERPFPTSVFLAQLAHSASRILGASIVVGSAESALAESLSVRPFGNP
jgi:hypothetical protein